MVYNIRKQDYALKKKWASSLRVNIGLFTEWICALPMEQIDDSLFEHQI